MAFRAPAQCGSEALWGGDPGGSEVLAAPAAKAPQRCSNSSLAFFSILMKKKKCNFYVVTEQTEP